MPDSLSAAPYPVYTLFICCVFAQGESALVGESAGALPVPAASSGTSELPANEDVFDLDAYACDLVSQHKCLAVCVGLWAVCCVVRSGFLKGHQELSRHFTLYPVFHAQRMDLCGVNNYYNR